jgi:hypothetical protein
MRKGQKVIQRQVMNHQKCNALSPDEGRKIAIVPMEKGGTNENRQIDRYCREAKRAAGISRSDRCAGPGES